MSLHYAEFGKPRVGEEGKTRRCRKCGETKILFEFQSREDVHCWECAVWIAWETELSKLQARVGRARAIHAQRRKELGYSNKT
jgi:hypothetical protein